MLVLTRRIGELILIGDEIELNIIEVKNDRVRLGITAPKEIRVRRQEAKPDHAGSI